MAGRKLGRRKGRRNRKRKKRLLKVRPPRPKSVHGGVSPWNDGDNGVELSFVTQHEKKERDEERQRQRQKQHEREEMLAWRSNT